MKLIKCSKNHYYDGDQFASCPHCANPHSQNAFPGSPISASRQSQEPSSASGMELTQIMEEPAFSAPEHHAPSVQPIQKEPSALESAVSASASYALPNETDKTVGFYDFDGDEPVVGWLVCIKGPHHGQSFSLQSGHNVVGRDLKMDIALTRDNSVSRSRHADILYDPKNSKFYIQQGESGFLYLNGELVLTPMSMQPRAIVGIGTGEYLFVPLCGEDFSWDAYKASDS